MFSRIHSKIHLGLVLSVQEIYHSISLTKSYSDYLFLVSFTDYVFQVTGLFHPGYQIYRQKIFVTVFFPSFGCPHGL